MESKNLLYDIGFKKKKAHSFAFGQCKDRYRLKHCDKKLFYDKMPISITKIYFTFKFFWMSDCWWFIFSLLRLHNCNSFLSSFNIHLVKKKKLTLTKMSCKLHFLHGAVLFFTKTALMCFSLSSFLAVVSVSIPEQKIMTWWMSSILICSFIHSFMNYTSSFTSSWNTNLILFFGHFFWSLRPSSAQLINIVTIRTAS